VPYSFAVVLVNGWEFSKKERLVILSERGPERFSARGW
jgi:hypothetical protein